MNHHFSICCDDVFLCIFFQVSRKQIPGYGNQGYGNQGYGNQGYGKGYSYDDSYGGSYSILAHQLPNMISVITHAWSKACPSIAIAKEVGQLSEVKSVFQYFLGLLR